MEIGERIAPLALIAGRCPRCRRGPVFKPLFSANAFSMYRACPVCDLDYEPEAGYFLGAMFVSYTIGILTVLPVAMFLILVLKASLAVTLLVALLQTLITMLLMFRYSRIIWLHLDQVIDPR